MKPKDNKGWITWSISRLGVMMAALVIMIIIYTIYQYVNCISASDSANKAAEELAAAITKTYSGPEGVQSTYALPEKINGKPYELNITKNGRGILITVYGTRCQTSGGGAPLSLEAAGYTEPEKNQTEENVTLVLTRGKDAVYIGKMDKCAPCIKILEFNYEGEGEECKDPNGEYVTFKNTCETVCDLKGWTVKDRETIQPKPAYEFPETILSPQSTVTLHSGCGTDTENERFWCNQPQGLCNAIWNNEGDTLYLREPAGILCIEYTYTP